MIILSVLTNLKKLIVYVSIASSKLRKPLEVIFTSLTNYVNNIFHGTGQVEATCSYYFTLSPYFNRQTVYLMLPNEDVSGLQI